MKNDGFAVKRLETMLRIWEQTMFVASAELRLTSPDSCTGAVKNWSKFRKTVIDLAHPYNREDFWMPKEQFRNYFVDVITYDFFPEAFASWSRSSRRVYSLSEDMQVDLELTSVSGITWNDLRPPFPCFVVKLPIPLKGMFKNQIDTLLVEIKPGIIRITTLGNELDSFKTMPPQMKNGIASASHHRNIRKLVARCTEARSGGYLYIPANQYGERLCNRLDREIVPDKHDVEKVEWVTATPQTETEKDQTLKFWIPIYRIVIGLCAHLDDLKDRVTDETSVKPPSTPHEITEDPNAITSTANLTLLTCEHSLTDEERRIHGIIREKGSIEALRELGAHYRGAHRRRPPGKGNDPTARKSVKVRWTIVNEDRLPEHALPAGAVVEVK